VDFNKGREMLKKGCKRCPFVGNKESRRGRSMTVCLTKLKQEVPTGLIPRWCPHRYHKISDLLTAFSIPMKVDTAFDIILHSERRGSYTWKNR
jgi:hypothetical protein